MPDYKPKVVKRMLKEKQKTIDAINHFNETIIKDEKAFSLNDYTERAELKSVEELYTHRVKQQAKAKAEA